MDLNDTVEVDLTEMGRKVVEADYRKLAERFNKDYRPKIGPNGEYKSQLWILFTMFGSYCGIGRDLVFKNLRKID